MKRPWLAPLVPLYAVGLSARALRLRWGWEPVRKLAWPVISIGNLSTGGSGKTPLTIALAKLLAARGVYVDVLSRGYGRTNREPARVDPNGTPDQLIDQYGDEPLLIAREAGAPVYVALRRFDAGLLAEGDISPAGQHDAPRIIVTRAHILDDGFQHRQLHRTVDILLLHRGDWQDSLLPAGNLREALHAAKRAHVIAISADDLDFETELRRWGWAGPVWLLHRRMEIPRIDGPVVAFCGIARPEQFFSGLEDTGLRLAVCSAYTDHYRYTADDLNKLVATARAAKAATLLTTEKDAVRLGALASVFPTDLPLKIAKLQIEIEDAEVAIDWLLARLAAGESSHRL